MSSQKVITINCSITIHADAEFINGGENKTNNELDLETQLEGVLDESLVNTELADIEHPYIQFNSTDELFIRVNGFHIKDH